MPKKHLFFYLQISAQYRPNLTRHVGSNGPAWPAKYLTKSLAKALRPAQIHLFWAPHVLSKWAFLILLDLYLGSFLQISTLYSLLHLGPYKKPNISFFLFCLFFCLISVSFLNSLFVFPLNLESN